jgi:hypothetical protein
MLTQEKPNFVVMMLGVSDRQNIRERDLAKEADKKKEKDKTNKRRRTTRTRRTRTKPTTSRTRLWRPRRNPAKGRMA